jgi:signal transduction histidine kinase
MNPSSILNVDHNRVRRQANSRLLSSAGLLVHESASGRDALHRVIAFSPDVVLLVAKLPDIHTLDMCRQLRAHPGFSSLILLRNGLRDGIPDGIHDGREGGSPAGPDAWLPQRCADQPFLATVYTLLRLRKAAMAGQIVQQCHDEAEAFAFQACHDLEEPVRALAAFAYMIEQSPARLSADEKMFLEQAHAGIERLRRLFGTVLSYSQIPRDHKPPRRVDLNLAAHAAIHGLDNPANEIQLDGPLPLVLGNLSRLQQVFECLLSNAIRYRRPELPLLIRISAQDLGANETLVSVADNGVGIARQYHQTIFQPFKRLHGRDIPGSGMGLAICKRIVEAHQGRIWVESEPGRGATFYFSLIKATPDE